MFKDKYVFAQLLLDFMISKHSWCHKNNKYFASNVNVNFFITK